MLLAIDVGNTETKLGAYAPGSDALLRAWRVTTESRRTVDEFGALLLQLIGAAGFAPDRFSGVAVASVVPTVDSVIDAAARTLLGVAPVFLKAHKQTLMPVLTDRPSEVGADLVAAAIGGRDRYGAPLIVVSYGTATVFTAISQEGAYAGVAIAPGINVSIDALVGRTAKLPQIAIEDPGHALGRTTIEALQAGIVYGFVGQTEALVARFRTEMGCDAKVVATGGLAEVVARNSSIIDEVDPHLSLEGLRLFYASQ
jgi:type III pantothenate kinase